MRQALVLGGTLFIGRWIVEALLRDGWRVDLMHRGHSPSPFGHRVREHLGDRRDPAAIKALSSGSYDAVVDTCAYESADLEGLLPALASGAGRYLFLSSVSVHATMTTFPTREDHPLFTGRGKRGEAAAYSLGKVACEEAVRSSGIPFTILRPAFVYGPWNTLYREAYYFDRIAEGELPAVGETGDYLTQLGHVEDLASAVLACLASDTAVGRTYFVTGDARSQRNTLQVLLDAVVPGSRPREEPASYAPWGIHRHLCVSTDRLRRETGWTPAHSLEEGLASTYKWYRSHGEERREHWDRRALRSHQTR